MKKTNSSLNIFIACTVLSLAAGVIYGSCSQLSIGMERVFNGAIGELRPEAPRGRVFAPRPINVNINLGANNDGTLNPVREKAQAETRIKLKVYKEAFETADRLEMQTKLEKQMERNDTLWQYATY